MSDAPGVEGVEAVRTTPGPMINNAGHVYAMCINYDKYGERLLITYEFTETDSEYIVPKGAGLWSVCAKDSSYTFLLPTKNGFEWRYPKCP